jgi:hypothetical protein
MSSQAQLAANRANGRKGRGPRSAAGKTRASRNALRHGLAAISRHNPAYFPEIGRMASAYCEGDTDPLLFEQALIIAESDIILICLGAERFAAIERMRDPDAIPFSDSKASLARARARFAQAKRAYAQLVKAKQAKAGSTPHKGKASISAEKTKEINSTSTDNPARVNAAATRSAKSAREPHPPAQRDECDAMCRAAPDLRRLERYERRAASRRNRAIREFIFIKSLREFRVQSEAIQTQ